MYKVYRKFTSLKRTIIARSLHLYCVGAIYARLALFQNNYFCLSEIML